MPKKSKVPLMRKSHLPIILLGAAMAIYGLAGALVGSWYSSQAMRGIITAGEYRSRLTGFEQAAGVVSGLVLFVLFILGAVHSAGLVRAAFVTGSLAAVSPLLVGRAENLLFNVIGLPTMNAGSVLAGAVTTILFALPMTILFILIASSGRVPRSCRWLSLLGILVVLTTSFYPIYVTLLAFLVRPGDPAVGRMMEVSTTLIKLRFILPGLIFLLMAWLSTRFEHRQAPLTQAANPTI